MKKVFSKKIRLAVFLVMPCLLALSAIVFGWTEPASLPPAGNVSEPLNVGATGQSKEGGSLLNSGGADNGFIAQDVEGVLLEMVKTVKEKIGEEEIEDFRVLSNDAFVPFLVQAIQEQQRLIIEQEERIGVLENQLKGNN
jgi:hypothetical protein